MSGGSHGVDDHVDDDALAVVPTKRLAGRKPLSPLAEIAPLTDRDVADLMVGDIEDVFARRRAEYLKYAHAMLQASPRLLARYSFGFAIQTKILERLLGRAFPETLRVEHAHHVQALSDDDLRRLVREVGSLADSGHIIDADPRPLEKGSD